MGPATLSSVYDVGPAILDGADVDNVIVCHDTSGPNRFGAGLVATLNGDGIEFYVPCIATQARSFSSVKALFN